MLIVKKFGGSSVADKECIFRVAERCAEDYKNGHDVIVVLSAMGDTTDDLIAKAKEINLNPSKREMDMLLTTGEQISVSLMAMAFHKLGIPAVSLNAFQVKMHSTSTYGNARFKKVESERILHELGYRKIVIVTGFQGVNKYEDYATIRAGRANPHILDKIRVDYYGTPTPLQQVANVSVPEARMIQIQPWESSLIKEIEKMIMVSDLGITPNNDGKVIRLIFPELTEDRRKEIVKDIKKKGENAKVAIRNVRRDANDFFKKQNKDNLISEDEYKNIEADVQKLTDKYIAEVDKAVEEKSKEILTV